MQLYFEITEVIDHYRFIYCHFLKDYSLTWEGGQIIPSRLYLPSWNLHISCDVAPPCGGFPTLTPPPISPVQQQQPPLLRHGELVEAQQQRPLSPSSLRWMLQIPWGLRGSGPPCASSSPHPVGSARPPDTVRRVRSDPTETDALLF